MNTKNFRTKTFCHEIKNGLFVPGAWVIGLDIGYSSVKTTSPNVYSCFPAYAEKQEGKEILAPSSGADDSIVYHDENGSWIVGATAQNAIRTNDTTAGSLAIYGRDRYFDDMFLVLARVGIAAGMRKSLGEGTPKMVFPYNDCPIYVSTGLPPMYKDTDEDNIREVLTGKDGEGMRHCFDVKFAGDSTYTHFDFSLTGNDMGVTDQPLGTMYSIMTGPDWKGVAKGNYTGTEIIHSNLLLVDPGFGTLDVEAVRMGRVQTKLSQTFDSLGMKQVFINTTEEIKERYKFEIPVPAFQRYLEQEYVQEKISRTEYVARKFDDILAKHNHDICEQALKKIVDIYNPAVDYDFFVLTGGTGAAWMNDIKNSPLFKSYETTGHGLRLLPGNAGDPDVPYLMQNSRGYYIYATYNMPSIKAKQAKSVA